MNSSEQEDVIKKFIAELKENKNVLSEPLSKLYLYPDVWMLNMDYILILRYLISENIELKKKIQILENKMDQNSGLSRYLKPFQ